MNTPDWVTASGERISLADLSDDHIRSVVRYLEAGDGEFGAMLRPGCSGFSNAEWLRLCAVELKRRNQR